MASIDDKIQPTHLSKVVDERYLMGISKYTNKDRLSTAEWEVLTMIKEDMKVRYKNYEDSKTFKAINRALEQTEIGMKTVQEDIYDKLSREYTAILYQCDISGIFSPNVRTKLSNRIDDINREMYPEYHQEQ